MGFTFSATRAKRRHNEMKAGKMWDSIEVVSHEAEVPDGSFVLKLKRIHPQFAHVRQKHDLI